jgi:Nif-specific regulatory protein
VRVVAATHRDLALDVQRGTFRRDLFYRLNVIPIRLPSLRERPEDIRALALHFLSRCNHAGQANQANPSNPRNVSLSAQALTRLEQHPWPGNIRELGNVIERLVLLTDSTVVSERELERFLPADEAAARAGPPVADPGAGRWPKQAAVHPSPPAGPSAPPMPMVPISVVRDYQSAQSHSAAQLQQALLAHGGNQSRAAQAVGLTVRQFSYRLRKMAQHNVANL